MKVAHSTIALTMVLIGLGVAVDAAESRATRPGMSWETMKDLPDFGGMWTPQQPLFSPPVATSGTRAATPNPPVNAYAILRNSLPPEVRPEVLAEFDAFVADVISGTRRDRGYCAQPAFTGRLPFNTGGSIEILFTPGRVTLAVESGLVRRLYLADEAPAEALSESSSGTSLAHWEGETLVVETTDLNSKASFVPGVALGRGARVLERISLLDADTLQVETTLAAPDVLNGAGRFVNRYRRARDRHFTEFSTCVEDDRTFDAQSGQERFDATPPPDLPPPPQP